MSEILKIGVVGFSNSDFNEYAALLKLRRLLEDLIIERGNEDLEIVSGYTNIGIPKLAYQLADELGILTTGFSAKQAIHAPCGLYPVHKKIIVGENFGDESVALIHYIDILIRLGGGVQSKHEVALFKAAHKGQNLNGLLFEEEVDW